MLETLLDNHRKFLGYLEKKVGNRALAEDILQDALTKVLTNPGQAPAGESIVPWFYRTLRNAAIDRFRRQTTASRALEAFARELSTQEMPSKDLEGEICACVSRLAETLKPEYAAAIRAIDVHGESVKRFADRTGLSPNNAAVRVFRARQALKKQVVASCGICADHGCVDCSCNARPAGA